MKTNACKRTLRIPKKSSGHRGVTLIMVLLILGVVSLLGVGGAQIALMSERGARNDRDQQVAWQSAEAGLIDAGIDVNAVDDYGRTAAHQLLYAGAVDQSPLVLLKKSGANFDLKDKNGFSVNELLKSEQ